MLSDFSDPFFGLLLLLPPPSDSSSDCDSSSSSSSPVLVVVLVLFRAVLALVYFFSDALPLEQPGADGFLSLHFYPWSRLFFERAPS